MRRNLLFVCLLLWSHLLFAQFFTASDFIRTSTVPRQKLNSFLSKEGFFRSQQFINGDTLVQEFQLNAKKIKEIHDSVNNRYAQGLSYENKTAFSYYTTSKDECTQIIRSLKENGFHSDNENFQAPFLYQKDDMLIKLCNRIEDSLTYYCFTIVKETIPSPKKIVFAEDFLRYNSHENLEYIFGKNNVQKDIYYFSDTDVVRCSVLFPYTERQVIFIWKDELNRRIISHLLIGGSIRTKKFIHDDRPIAENVWSLKNGLHANMSLAELLKMNNADFSFYGLQSKYSGAVIPVKKGNIDFKNTGVILSCLNCNSSKLMRQETISAEDAIANSERLFVLALIIMPQNEDNLTAFHR